MMDDIDRKLLARLQEDATTPIADLADHVGLSPTPVWKRIQKMEAAAPLPGAWRCWSPSMSAWA